MLGFPYSPFSGNMTKGENLKDGRLGIYISFAQKGEREKKAP